MKIKNNNALTFTGIVGGDIIVLEGDYYNGCNALGTYMGKKAKFDYNPANCRLTIKSGGGVVASVVKEGCKPSKFFFTKACFPLVSVNFKRADGRFYAVSLR